MDESKQEKKKINKNLITLLVVALISLGAGFFGGVEYQKTKKVTFNRTGAIQGQYGTSKTTGSTTTSKTNGNVSRPVSGEITSIDNGTITVKAQDGSSKIIVISSSTKIEVTTTGSTSDLKTGDTVSIIGTTDTSGTVSAQSVFVGGSIMQQSGNAPQGADSGQPPQGN